MRFSWNPLWCAPRKLKQEIKINSIHAKQTQNLHPSFAEISWNHSVPIRWYPKTPIRSRWEKCLFSKISSILIIHNTILVTGLWNTNLFTPDCRWYIFMHIHKIGGHMILRIDTSCQLVDISPKPVHQWTVKKLVHFFLATITLVAIWQTLAQGIPGRLIARLHALSFSFFRWIFFTRAYSKCDGGQS